MQLKQMVIAGQLPAEALQKIEVISLCIPLEGLVSHTLEHITQPRATLLSLIVRAAAELGDYSVFETLTMRAMLQYKWKCYAEYFFHRDAVHFGVLLFFHSIAMCSLPRLCHTSHNPSICDEKSFLNAVAEMFCSGRGVVTFVSLVFSWFGSTYQLLLLISTLLVDGRGIRQLSMWRILDIATFGSSLAVGLRFIFFRVGNPITLCATSAWLFCMRILSLAKGTEQLGLFVLMIEKIVADTKNFAIVLIILLAAFMLAFGAMLQNPLHSVIWVWNSGVIGLSPPGDMDPTDETELTVNTMALECLYLMSTVVMLNLLIAIMGSSYESVRADAELEVANQRGKIILEYERFYLPHYLRRPGVDFDFYFPSWLHVLTPTAVADAEESRIVARQSLIGEPL